MSKQSTKVIARRLRRYLGGMLAVGFGATWWTLSTPPTALASTIALFDEQPVVEARVPHKPTRTKPVVAPAKPILDLPVIDILSTASRRPFEVVSAIASLVDRPTLLPPPVTRPNREPIATMPVVLPVIATTHPFATPPVRVTVVPSILPPVVVPPTSPVTLPVAVRPERPFATPPVRVIVLPPPKVVIPPKPPVTPVVAPRKPPPEVIPPKSPVTPPTIVVPPKPPVTPVVEPPVIDPDPPDDDPPPPPTHRPRPPRIRTRSS